MEGSGDKAEVCCGGTKEATSDTSAARYIYTHLSQSLYRDAESGGAQPVRVSPQIHKLLTLPTRRIPLAELCKGGT